MTDLNALMIFAKVVEAKSFSEAARRLAMPVSTVSRRVADLETELGARLLVRSTRNVRLTEAGSEVIQHARKSAEVSDAVDRLMASKRMGDAGLLRLSAPPSISDSLLAPLVASFRHAFPDLRVKVFISGRITDDMSEGVDLEVKIGPRRETTLVTQKILTYRHQLVASPAYLRAATPVETPRDLLDHPLLALRFRASRTAGPSPKPEGTGKETLRFRPHLSMSDYAGLTSLMLADSGIGDLPPVVRPDLLRDGRLVEVLPSWTLPVFDLSLVHPVAREISRPMRAFKDFAARTVPTLFPDLPH